MKRLIILGASGSIGQQSLDVIEKYNEFLLVAFSVGHNTKCISSILKTHPEVEALYLRDKNEAELLKSKYPNVKIFNEEDGLISFLNSVKYDCLENALVGFVGLLPTITALKENKTVYLANKESLVVGGEIINNLLKEGHGRLIPIDSEHVAIAKCLACKKEGVSKLIITASGGAFRMLTRDECKNMKKEDALRHPTWKMGEKITIDSTSMMNKCFEIIEAYYLFNVSGDDIEVLLHDKSYVHSLVAYNDGFILADIGQPDMRKPISWALSEGKLYSSIVASKDIKEFGQYNFYDFDMERYPLVHYAYEVIKNKGIYGAILNASNEIAVQAFLCGEISFLQIDEIVNNCMRGIKNITDVNYEIIKKVDEETRIKARKLVEELR